ncbi:MAG: alpha/beta hydrolase [Candidatus Binatus sp.]
MEKIKSRGINSKFGEPESSFVNVNGIRLHTLDWGGDGTPIVILHATGLLGRIYRPLAERLRAIGHVYSYDQRGHGDSSAAPGGDYNWDWTMRDLEGFIRATGWPSVRAVGHSAGATAIGSLACERPDLISRAVLVEPVIFESPTAPELGWRNPFIERTLKRRRIFDSVEAMYSNFESKPPYNTWRKDILRDYCEFGTRPTSDGKRELKCAPEVEAKFYEASRDFDGLGRILRCTTPLLLMFGARGDSLGASLSGKVAKQLKNGRVIDVADTGHFLPMEKPDYVAHQAIEFFKSGE